MKFEEALAAAREGKSIQSPTWENIYLRVVGGILTSFYSDGRKVQGDVSLHYTDIMSTKWKIVFSKEDRVLAEATRLHELWFRTAFPGTSPVWTLVTEHQVEGWLALARENIK